MVEEYDFGLELTNNSKVGWAFSLPRSKTCVDATSLCKKLCYGNGIRYQSAGQKSKRERNFHTAEFLLQQGGAELLAENLSLMVEQARPRDWLAAKISGRKTNLPWTLRIHDIGDFYSVEYIKAWTLVVQKYSECSFWFYTRSFAGSGLLAALTILASLPNCQGWLSVDSENYAKAILAMCNSPVGIWKFALLQDKDLDVEIASTITSAGAVVVNFPYHHGGRHVIPLKEGMTCPAVTGLLSLQSNKDKARPCQLCSFCLPPG